MIKNFLLIAKKSSKQCDKFLFEPANLTLKVLVTTIYAHRDTLKQDNHSTLGGDGGCRVGEVRAGVVKIISHTGTTSPMPDHKGFKLQ